ncbi:hypothetical protein ABIE26_003984 [Pedobacter africanus]|uniref:Uncharacterized protein n=1 Tax=Pedobacter africanus TaxID=151894 RepID=A0ACC6L1I2_9SPHI|nr:hypothetical protein [Pedobacter africanus]MDR6785285.1 hypothetical protein [Pedobacter africanus]
MFKINIQPERLPYLRHSIWIEIDALMNETLGFTMSWNDNQIRLKLIGAENTILINFHDDKIKMYKTSLVNKSEQDNLFQKISEIIEKSVSGK